MSITLDAIDLQILNTLQKDGRAQRNELATVVNLSVPSVSERMRKLEERGLIDHYVAVLNPKRFQFDITAFIFVEVDGSENYPSFTRNATEHPEILECHSITGDGSHILKIRTKNTESLERLLSQIQTWEGVHKTRSNIVLSSFKESQNLPIELTVDLKS